jgi:hypothetical protein
VCLKRQEQSAQGEDKKNGEDFAGDGQRVFHNKANVMCCVLSVKIKMRGGANFFPAPYFRPLVSWAARASAMRECASLMDASAADRSMSEGSRPPAASKQSSHQAKAARYTSAGTQPSALAAVLARSLVSFVTRVFTVTLRTERVRTRCVFFIT